MTSLLKWCILLKCFSKYHTQSLLYSLQLYAIWVNTLKAQSVYHYKCDFFLQRMCVVLCHLKKKKRQIIKWAIVAMRATIKPDYTDTINVSCIITPVSYAIAIK